MAIEIRNIKVGDNLPFVLIAGPCVVESEELILSTAEKISDITSRLGINFIFKSSFKKANRTNLKSFSGLGDEKAISILSKVREKLKIPVLTDIHTEEDIEKVKDAVDVIQIPAFLCRQTELLLAAGKSGLTVNIKKGQFLAPEDMKHTAEKVLSTGNKNILLTERGTTFGYHNLVVDMRSIVIMRELGFPVVMDATHSVQLPSKENVSGGQPKFIKPLARAAAAVGIDALFLEVHPEPAKALSDAASQLPLSELEQLLAEVKAIDSVIKTAGLQS
ncbi:MAG: 3-deoxy-8-phosphooctulonate synthase [Ignavibacterium album]|uniref:3-deoxy-8-phosphooctulonate synthase n=1 Tax=Ignavibacterium album TaxID=591197 RepID=UPI0026EBCC83|nr:3-deoxy-8-phosphooctulonate synthase [Ignavibacterium album]MCX8106470.1 3-deoxy-8-phosphooctulonate synthase [Ignavibacterium album]